MYCWCNSCFQYGRRIIFNCCHYFLQRIRTECDFEFRCWTLQVNMWDILTGFRSQWHWKDWRLFWHCVAVSSHSGSPFYRLISMIKKRLPSTWQFCHWLYFACMYYCVPMFIVFYCWYILCYRISYFYCNFGLL
jgi:hypothetical protein